MPVVTSGLLFSRRQGRRRRALTMGLVFLGSWLGLFAGSAALLGQEKTVNENPRIVVGTEADYPPFSRLDANGQPTGFNVELTQAIAAVMGMEVEINYGPWGEVREALEKRRIQAICGMFYSKERAQLVDFSPPFTSITQAIFARADSPAVESIQELRGKQLIVMRGDIMHDYVRQQGLAENPVVAETQASALRLLASGKHDYALVAKLPGLYWIGELKLTNLRTVGTVAQPADYCFAVAKGDMKTLSQFSEGLSILKQTGRYKEIYDKWLGILDPPEFSWRQGLTFAGITAVPLILIVGGVLVWSRSLKKLVTIRTAEVQNAMKVAEAANRAKQEQVEELEHLYRTTPVGLSLVDRNYRIVRINELLASNSGKSVREHIGKTLRK